MAGRSVCDCRIVRLPHVILTLPAGDIWWAAVAGGLVVLSIGIAAIVGMFGLFGFAPDTPAGTTAQARVVTPPRRGTLRP
jgi:hypothetical protein